MRKTAHTGWDEHLIHRVTGEYLEMPGLCLTCQQAQHLWNLDHQTCQTLLDALIDLRFLVRTSDGKYVRSTDGSVVNPPRQMAKAIGAPLVAARRKHVAS
jgi:hypothetical protein